MSTPGGADRFEPSVPYGSLDLTGLAEMPEEARSEALFMAGEVMNAVVDDWCLRTAAELGQRAGASAADLGIAADRVVVWDWIVQKLLGAGLVARDADGAPTDLAPRRFSERGLADAVDSMRPVMGSTFDLIAAAGRSYPAFLRGEVDGPTVLLSPEVRPLWYRYFHNDNLAYGIINRIAADVLARRVEGDALRVLEVGGGCGSGAEALLARVRPRVERYCFTEPVPWFLLQAKQLLAQRHPDLTPEFRRLDLNRDLAEQGFAAQSVDVVYAVNVLHAVRDLVGALRQLHDVLAPGGTIVLGEAVRPAPGAPVAPEFVFLMMPEFRDVHADPELRPHGGFLYHRHWLQALERAGFVEARCAPDLDAVLSVYPGYTLAALSAVRSRGAS